MKTEKVEKLVAILHDKEKCYRYENFKTCIKSWISIEQVHNKCIEWLNSIKKLGSNHTLIWTQRAKKNAKNDFEKTFSSWRIMQFLEKL